MSKRRRLGLSSDKESSNSRALSDSNSRLSGCTSPINFNEFSNDILPGLMPAGGEIFLIFSNVMFHSETTPTTTDEPASVSDVYDFSNWHKRQTATTSTGSPANIHSAEHPSYREGSVSSGDTLASHNYRPLSEDDESDVDEGNIPSDQESAFDSAG